MRAICREVAALVKLCGKPKMLDAIKLPPPELYKHVEVCDYLSLFGNSDSFVVRLLFVNSFLLLTLNNCMFATILTFVNKHTTKNSIHSS